MTFRLKNQEAQSFLEAYSNGEFSKKLNERINWMLSRGRTFKEGFRTVVACPVSFALCINLLISSGDIEEHEE